MKEVEEVIDLLLYRPMAFLIVIAVYKTKIKPNHLTLIAMLIGITGGLFYSLGTHQSAIAGAFSYLLFNILDCSDGQLARIKKNGSSVGRLLDGIADYIAGIAIYTGIAIGYAGISGQPSVFVMLLVLAGLSIFIQESLVDYYRTRFLDVVLQRQDTFIEGMEEYQKEYDKIKIQKGKWFGKFIVLIYLAYSRLQRFLTPKKKRLTYLKSNPDQYFNLNHIIIRLWVFMGPSAKITVLIVCSLFCRFDIFFWIVIGGFNILAVLLWLFQYRIDTL
jgi:phosphatidylglycerophosphate synthase